jgi:hypothetical protein
MAGQKGETKEREQRTTRESGTVSSMVTTVGGGEHTATADDSG